MELNDNFMGFNHQKKGFHSGFMRLLLLSVTSTLIKIAKHISNLPIATTTATSPSFGSLQMQYINPH